MSHANDDAWRRQDDALKRVFQELYLGESQKNRQQSGSSMCVRWSFFPPMSPTHFLAGGLPASTSASVKPAKFFKTMEIDHDLRNCCPRP